MTANPDLAILLLVAYPLRISTGFCRLLEFDMHENLYPRGFVKEILESTLPHFLAIYGETPFLCVRLSGPYDAILDGLLERRSAPSERDTSPSEEPEVMSFITDSVYQGKTAERVNAPKIDIDTKEIRESFASAHHVVVPLVNRDRETVYVDRISIGRSRNKDIVLRHQSVSKFHAWFETDESGAVYIADAGSKNGTIAKAELIKSRRLTRLDSGDRISFGSVRAVYLLPETLWKIVHDN